MHTNFISPHVHVSSFDSASTPEIFCRREMELGTGYVTVTDHGSLEATRTLYDLCAPGGKYHGQLKPIAGLEAYFRDDNDDILRAAGKPRSVRYRHLTDGKVLSPEAWAKLGDEEKKAFAPEEGYWDHIKYMHLTLHAQDERAMSVLTQRLSLADMRAEQHGSERKPLFTWQDLEILGQENICFCSSCLIGMVSRHLLAHDDTATARAYYQKVRSLVKAGNFWVELFPFTCDRNWDEAVFVRTTSGVEQRYPPWKKLKTHEGEFKAQDLANEFQRNGSAAAKHKQILAVMTDRKMTDIEPLDIIGVEYRQGFIYNECRPWAPDRDVQLGVNRFLLELAREHGDKILVSDDSHMAYPSEYEAQNIRLGQMGSWRFANVHARMDSSQAFAWFQAKMGVSAAEFQSWVENSYEWASGFDAFRFSPRKAIPTKFYPEDSLGHTWKLIQEHGRMRWQDERYVQRLANELQLLHQNGVVDLLPYLQIDEEVCRLYKRAGLITGAGRGSAAGLLLAYLLGITHVDPLRYGLSQDRFLSLTRIKGGKLPDIDQDLQNQELVQSWLQERFGPCHARISTDLKIRLKTAIKDTFRVVHGPGSHQLQIASAVAHKLPDPPQGVEDKDFIFGYQGSDGTHIPGLIEYDPGLQEFASQWPKEWETIQKLIGLPRSKGAHPCGFVIANEPIDTFIPMTTVAGKRVTAFTAATVEAAGGLKMDFLGLNSLKDIQAALKLIQARHGGAPETNPWLKDPAGNDTIGDQIWPRIYTIPWRGGVVAIFDLPEDHDVFADICAGRTETVFQFDTPGAQKWLRQFAKPKADGRPGLSSIEDLAAFTALDRPGPLDYYVDDGHGGSHNMLVEYARRARGEPPCGNPQVQQLLRELLPETHGILCYQEGLMRVFQVLGQTTGEQADNFRVHISKKQVQKVMKDKEVFMPGAVARIGSQNAEELWRSLEAFANYGFNKSHAICYVVTSYACAWLKHHFPLEWWTAVLQNADRNEVQEKFWAHCGHLIDMPSYQYSGPNFELQGNRIQAPLSLLKGIGDKAREQLQVLGQHNDIKSFCLAIQTWRRDNGKMVTRIKKTKEGLETSVQSLRMATTALNSKVIWALIISGTLDCLFPRIKVGDQEFEQSLEQKLMSWLEAEAEALTVVYGKKQKPKTKFKTMRLDSWELYQHRKEVLPVFNQYLGAEVMAKLTPRDPGEPWPFRMHALVDQPIPTLVYRPTDWHSSETWPVASPQLLLRAITEDIKVSFCFATIDYVSGDRRWRFANKETGPGLPATVMGVELTLDCGGVIHSGIRWPGKNGQTGTLKDVEDLKGAIVVCFWKRSPGTTTSPRLVDVEVVIPAQKSEEESEENDDNEE